MTDLLTTLKPTPVKPTTATIMIALRERFCAPEFALFEEVGDSGSSSGVYADAVAVNMWASRGYAISGFEVKASRSDWLRELKRPDKSEPILTKCDFWYLVAPDEIYQPDEVPISWGILSFKDGKIREKRKAPKLDPKPITRAFVAQMFRRGHNKEKRDISARIAKSLADDRAAMEKRIAEQVESKTHMLQREAEKWKTVCDAVGKDWLSEDQIVSAVRVVLRAGITGTYAGIDDLLRKTRKVTKDLEEAAAMFAHKSP